MKSVLAETRTGFFPNHLSVLAADVTDRLKSAEGEPKGIEQSQSSIGGEHLDRGSKHGGDPSSHSSIHTSTHPSRTESGRFAHDYYF